MELAIIIALIVWALSARGMKLARQGGGPARQGPRVPEAGGPAGPGRVDKPAPRAPARPRGLTTFPKEAAPRVRPTTPTHWEETGGGARGSAMAPRRTTSVIPPPSPRNAVEDPMRLISLDAAPVSVPGLNLAFDADSLVRGVLYAEILARKGAGRRN